MALNHRPAIATILLGFLLFPLAGHTQDKPLKLSPFSATSGNYVVFTDALKSSLFNSRITHGELEDLLKTVKQQQRTIKSLQERVAKLEGDE